MVYPGERGCLWAVRHLPYELIGQGRERQHPGKERQRAEEGPHTDFRVASLLSLYHSIGNYRVKRSQWRVTQLLWGQLSCLSSLTDLQVDFQGLGKSCGGGEELAQPQNSPQLSPETTWIPRESRDRANGDKFDLSPNISSLLSSSNPPLLLQSSLHSSPSPSNPSSLPSSPPLILHSSI